MSEPDYVVAGELSHALDSLKGLIVETDEGPHSYMCACDYDMCVQLHAAIACVERAFRIALRLDGELTPEQIAFGHRLARRLGLMSENTA